MATDPVPAVELRGLFKQFGGHEVLVSIDLAVMPGGTVCIVGPSGSGKSTLLRCINWLERPDRGSVFLHGVRVGYRRSDGGNVLMSDRELAMLRTRIGMVFQHFNLWPHMTALGNVVERLKCWKTIPIRVRSIARSEEHTSELQSLTNLVCRLLLEKKKKKQVISYKTNTAVYVPAESTSVLTKSLNIQHTHHAVLFLS